VETVTHLSADESIKLIRDAQNLSHLRAISGKWFCFFVSLITGVSFGLLSNQSALALIPILFFPVIVYIEKRKKGLWPLGFAPVLRQGTGLYSFSDYWKDTLKVKTSIHIVNLIAMLIMLSFPLFFIRILEFRDSGIWWAPIASGTIMALSHFTILMNYRNFQFSQFSNKDIEENGNHQSPNNNE